MNFSVMILKACTQTRLICIAVGFTKRHVPMGNRGNCTLSEGMWIIQQSPSSLIGLNRLKAIFWRKSIFFQDFLMATDPVTFLIRIVLPKAFQLQEDICLDNGRTKERLKTEMEKADPNWDKALLISRHPLASKKKWIVFGNEYYGKTIYLCNDLKFVPT
jgi:hypothetical protein